MKWAALFISLLLLATPVLAKEIVVSSTPIDHFASEGQNSRFGRLEYLGGLKLTSRNSDFQSLSAIRFLPGGKKFIAVSDAGDWVDGEITRNSNGYLNGVKNTSVNPIKNTSGIHTGKRGLDAESLTITGNNILVGFEGRHRIDSYPLKSHDTATAVSGPDILIPTHELRRNGGFEALATNANGKVVAIAEKSIDQNGNLFAAILKGPQKGIFKVVKRQGFDVTDASFLPNGDLLVLERRFSLLSGIAMRIRRIPGQSINPGALVDGHVVMSANGAEHHIDNMEGIDTFLGPDGSTHIILISDDNDSMMQKTLMLEFRLIN